jgi:uncharacterized protein
MMLMDVGIVVGALALTLLIARRFAVPLAGTWATLCALAVASWRLHSSGMRWNELGLSQPENVAIALAWVAALFLAATLVKVLIVEPLGKAAGWPPTNLSRFANLPGNTAFLAGGLVVAWVGAAFGEELVFRGFLLTRLELLLGAGLSATVLAVAAQAMLFGAGHWYLGPRGLTMATSLGLILGIVYVCDGRNLVPLIAAHGLADSMSLIAIYAGVARVA